VGLRFGRFLLLLFREEKNIPIPMRKTRSPAAIGIMGNEDFLEEVVELLEEGVGVGVDVSVGVGVGLPVGVPVAAGVGLSLAVVAGSGMALVCTNCTAEEAVNPDAEFAII